VRTSLAWRLAPGIVGVVAALLVLGVLLDPGEPLSSAAPWIDPGALATAVDSLGEILAAILGLALTVVAIVVELAAQRSSTRLVDLFLRDRVNRGMFVLLVVSCLYVVLLPALQSSRRPLPVASGIALLLAVIDFALLLPYLGYVFTFLRPESVIDRLLLGGEKGLAGGGRSAEDAPAVCASISRISDSALSAIGQLDRNLGLHAISALESLAVLSLGGKGSRSAGFFTREAGVMPTLSGEAARAIIKDKAWVEGRILVELEHLGRRALRDLDEVVSKIASSTRAIGHAALEVGDGPVLELAVRLFHTSIRHGLNAGNVRAVYHVLYHLRGLAAELLEREPVTFRRIIERLVDYGRIANGMGLPFVTVTVAHDLRILLQGVCASRRQDLEPLLALFLDLDEPALDDDGSRRLALSGVRKAQSILGAWLLARGEEALAEKIREDLRVEPGGRLRAVLDELLAVEDPRFWELTDRGENFDWVDEELRPHLRRLLEPLVAEALQ